jgi:hypothetical protein
MIMATESEDGEPHQIPFENGDQLVVDEIRQLAWIEDQQGAQRSSNNSQGKWSQDEVQNVISTKMQRAWETWSREDCEDEVSEIASPVLRRGREQRQTSSFKDQRLGDDVGWV